jgi:hypothetical protein
LRDELPEESKSCPVKDIEHRPKKLEFIVRYYSKDSAHKLVPYIPSICGKDEAVDPFNCTAVKIDSNMHSLIEFYLARLHPVSYTLAV